MLNENHIISFNEESEKRENGCIVILELEMA